MGLVVGFVGQLANRSVLRSVLAAYLYADAIAVSREPIVPHRNHSRVYLYLWEFAVPWLAVNRAFNCFGSGHRIRGKSDGDFAKMILAQVLLCAFTPKCGFPFTCDLRLEVVYQLSWYHLI